MKEIGLKPARTVAELASARQHQSKNRPTIMERAVEGMAGRGECGFPAEAGGATPPGRAMSPQSRGLLAVLAAHFTLAAVRWWHGPAEATHLDLGCGEKSKTQKNTPGAVRGGVIIPWPLVVVHGRGEWSVVAGWWLGLVGWWLW